MIKLELTLDNIDYDALAERYLPYFRTAAANSGNPMLKVIANTMPPELVKKFVHSLPQGKKDELCKNLINANLPALMQNAHEAMQKMGVNARIVEAKAETI